MLRILDDINENGTLPENAKPISIDIKSMYTNIPLEEGLEAFKITLEKHSDKTVPSDYIIKLLGLIMEKNVFTFDEEQVELSRAKLEFSFNSSIKA